MVKLKVKPNDYFCMNGSGIINLEGLASVVPQWRQSLVRSRRQMRYNCFYLV